ncbi:MAG: class II D-tagatose-bisphosphate aldolase, non-catalytic subunit [Coriobacteriia bacterium]|nr:class II D-tagatose-bisphosphate aldolase, non-catalytic subunit [Coriobacteriia bacterium]
MEDQLVDDPSHLTHVVEEIMLADPSNWQKHYHGNDHELKLVVDKKLSPDPKELVLQGIYEYMSDYEYATFC